MSLQLVVDEAVASTPGVRWSIAITGHTAVAHEPDRRPPTAGAGELPLHAADTPPFAAAHEPDRRLRTASVGKLLLLAEAARQFEAGTLDPDEPLHRRPDLAVADSGLWQHLAAGALPAADVAALIGAVSDNLATNVLLDRVGPAAVAELTRSLGLRDTALLDRVRDRREPHHPPTLSHGTAAELAGLTARIGRGELVSPAVSARMDHWLALNTDLSMVAAGLDLDPLAHVDPGPAGRLRNKTGTDDGIRADVGRLDTPGGSVAYAVLAEWVPTRPDRTTGVLHAMRRIGAALAPAPPPH